MKNITQDKEVLNFLQERGKISPLEALQEIGCFRLSARILQLRKQGHQIVTKRISKQGEFRVVNFAEYHLISKDD